MLEESETSKHGNLKNVAVSGDLFKLWSQVLHIIKLRNKKAQKRSICSI